MQPEPGGIAQAFLIGRDFIGRTPVALALGDNLFYGHGLPESLRRPPSATDGRHGLRATTCATPSATASSSSTRPAAPSASRRSPRAPRSSWAVTGLYFYDADVVDIAAALRPSARGELEITDVNGAYLRQRRAAGRALGRGIAWLDTGTHEALLQASTFIQTIETRQGLMVACLEEIAFRMGWIASPTSSGRPSRCATSYGQYLLRLLAGEP